MTAITVKTRSGRVSKAPERMKPTETNVDDDFADDDHDTEYEVSDDDLCETESEDECDESDEDEDGNLKGFVVDDTDEDQESEEEIEA
jgi:hypothetical protein|tara:strand:+ start:773 stop:1036 length:264 start_codon:yes stop_codon:yes gene_type:complete